MDDFFQDAINGLAGHVSVLDFAMKVSAQDLVYLAPLLLLALWFWPASLTSERALNQRLAFATGCGVLAAVALAAVAGHLHAAPRPFVSDDDPTRLLIGHTADNGFPSDHTALAFAIGGAMICWRHALGLFVLACAAVVGFARVYVGVHFPSDVIAGAAVGLACGLLVARLVPLLEAPQRLASRVLPSLLLASG